MNMIRFYPGSSLPNESFRYAVFVAKYQGKYVFCKHRKRETFEIPGGHREQNEPVDHAAERELWEETGARQFVMHPVGAYSVTGTDDIEVFGKLFLAEITELGPLPGFEIEKIFFFSEIPQNLTYPGIQPVLIRHAEKIIHT